MYTDIEIDAPDSARDGDEVDVVIKVTNLTSAALNIDVGGILEPGNILFMGFETRLIEPGATGNFSGSFIMHGYDVTIHAQSYFQDTLDNEAEMVVSLKEAPSPGCLPSVLIGLAILAAIGSLTIL